MEFILRGDRILSNFSNRRNQSNPRNLSKVCGKSSLYTVYLYSTLPEAATCFC